MNIEKADTAVGKITQLGSMEFSYHQRRLLAAVLRKPGILRSSIGKKLDLSPQTMMRAINPMVETGILSEIEELDGLRGKPPRKVSYNRGTLATLGVTLAIDRVIVEFSDLSGDTLSRQAVEKQFSSARTQLAQLFDTISEASMSLSSESRVVCGVVVAQGYFLERGRKIIASSDPEGWAEIDLYEELRNRLGIEVTIVNDGTAFAGSMTGITRSGNFLGVYIGNGIGGGIVSDGQLIGGAFGNAGEIGRFFDEGQTRPTESSLKSTINITSWENWAGISALSSSERQLLEQWMDDAAIQFGRAVTLALALLDFDTVYIGSRMPGELLKMLTERIDLEPLGIELAGTVSKRHTPKKPDIIFHHISQFSRLANTMAVEQFVSPSPDFLKQMNISEPKFGHG